MNTNLVSRCGLTLLLAMAELPAFAQYGKSPDPSDPRTPAPAAKIESAFPAYQSYRDQQIRPWKESNQEVADNPGMGAMGGMPGMAGHNMPGMDAKGAAAGHDMESMPGMPGIGSKSGVAPKANSRATVGHDMGSMPGMPGMGSKPGAAAKPHGADGHDHRADSMPGMPGMSSKAGATPKPHDADGHDHAKGTMQGMPGMSSKPDDAKEGPVTGTGIVKSVDKANGRVRLTHDPIEAKGWPKMTLFFRLRDNSLADRVTEGDSVEFSLEKSASGYVISDLKKSAAIRATQQAK